MPLSGSSSTDRVVADLLRVNNIAGLDLGEKSAGFKNPACV